MFEEFKNAFSRTNNGHVQLILLNVILFIALAVVYVVATVSGYGNVFKLVHDQFSLSPVPSEFLTRPWTLITYAFAHSLSDIWHILFNMISLYWFGKLFLEYLGNDRLIALYVLGALAGGVLYLLLSNTIPFFQAHAATGMVGASAAIYAIMVGSATLLPDYTFFLLFFGPVRIKYIAFFFILLSFLGTVSANAGGNIAHLGGALIGFVYVRQLQRGRNLGGWITAILNAVAGIFRPKPKIRVEYRREGPSVSRKETTASVSQQEIDAILDKISERGYESLSREEKEKLFRAGKK